MQQVKGFIKYVAGFLEGRIYRMEVKKEYCQPFSLAVTALMSEVYAHFYDLTGV